MEAKKRIGIDGNFTRMLSILVFLLVFAGITRGSSFISVANFQNIAKQLTEYGLMTLGVAIAMISGGIDLSTVYVANLSAICAGTIMQQTAPNGEIAGILLACAAALVIGLACGFMNGLLISVLHIPAMLATLGSYEFFYGIGIVLSKGRAVSSTVGFGNLSGALIFGIIPVPILIFLLAAVVLTFIMGHTTFGKQVHMIGISNKASMFTGINNTKVIITVYVISGFLSSAAGLISLSRVSSVKADFGSSYVMLAILITVLGGCDPNGGFGEIPGVATAVLVMQVIAAYLNTLPGVSNYYRQLLYGILLLAVMTFNYEMRRRKGRVKKLRNKEDDKDAG